ncbi:MAG: tetratricopeptide repeat protein [Muribaculaceae bacterium]|nr:tetratricopeptide repeat protein [Muribaculaceae bacterium]
MKKQDIALKKNSIIDSIKNQNLYDAFKQLRAFSESQMTWEITDEITRLEESYRYMLDYAIRGIADPSRKQVYEGLVAGMLTILNRLERHAMTPETPSLYYNTLRYRSHAASGSIPEYLRRYSRLASDSSLFNLVKDGRNDAADQNNRKREAVERDLFDALWVTFPLSVADYEALTEALASDVYPDYFKQLIINGVLLGALEFYDSRRVQILARVYYSGSEKLAPIALVAQLLVLYKYRNRTLDKQALDAVRLMPDNPAWHSDLKEAFLELVRARDTERITRKMTDEVLPEMIKLRPELNRKFKDLGEISDAIEMEENPEWQEMLEKSGIADKLKELTEIQLEGGDVFMSTFAHLKSFSFFNEIANWFMPFHSDYSDIASMPAELAEVARLIESTPVFCNSDKYSFVLSLQSIPQSQRELMKSQLNMQIDGMLEMQRESLDESRTSRRSVMNRYVQDLYRFFKLFRRKAEFDDPFVSDLNLVTIPALRGQFRDSDTLKAIAEFYFRHKYYGDAINIFKVIEENTYPDGQLFEKMGYCYERTGNIEEALRYYEQAELLDAGSVWTLRHIARCHRLLGQPAKALEYYRRVAEKEGDSESIQTVIAMGNCYLDMAQWGEASGQYFKARYLDEKSTRVIRPLAWSLLMQKDFMRARELYDEILKLNPTADDYLNMGHLALAVHDHDNALNFYKLSISAGDGLIETFASRLIADAKALETVGIDSEIIPLILDSINYSER